MADNMDDDPMNLTGLQRELAAVDDDILYEVEDDVQVQILDPDTLYETRDQSNVTVGRGSETSARRSSRFHLVSPKVGRSQNDFIRAGIRGSIGSARSSPDAYVDTEAEKERADEEARHKLIVSEVGPIIDGRPMKVRKIPVAIKEVVPVRQWDKTKRFDLAPDIRQAFYKQATQYVLSKSNKLNTPKISASAKNQLDSVHNIATQLKALAHHMTLTDIGDVTTIVVPVNVSQTPSLEDEKYDLLRDFHKLHITHVLNSNTWYNTWAAGAYVRDNMLQVYLLFENNTDGNLWTRCLDTYEGYSPVQQGGPLMVYLVLQAIQNSSEQALDHLLGQLRSLDISKLPGEDVEKAVILIRTTYLTLKGACTKDRNFIPSDFIKLVYNILLTPTVTEFTEPLRAHQRMLQLQADLKGTRPEYPSVSDLLTLALTSYRRLDQSQVWAARVRAHHARSNKRGTTQSANNATSSTSRSSSTGGGSSGYERHCWNCGSTNHVVTECDKPRNQSKIDAERKKWLAAKKSKGDTPEKKTDPDTGRPMILNKNGLYVLDQKAWKALQGDAAEGSTPATSGEASASPSVNLASSSETIVYDVEDQASKIRSALKRRAEKT